MKKTISAMFVLLAFAGTAFAAAPETIKMKKDVTFNHKAHMATVGDCKKCHEKGPGKIEGFGKEWAHKNCKGCHTEMKKGPTSCKDCHKSS
ncbi:cytochrome c7 [Geobacter sp. SVR]|uniref:cytochrome c7 n=1 Tax=Geobacter sp. SVR TaxID=2495594 RepID=UPI00143F04F9|nr:cytochrome c7 [Geobacter sp. SVR]BCS56080.1 cytochrome c [Geobacter sp. SVR]GCF84843.1 cytochrome c [Geobacter sp. SVR]